MKPLEKNIEYQSGESVRSSGDAHSRGERERAYESELVARAQGGDSEAFDALVKDCFPVLLRFCATLGGRDAAADVAQDAIVQAIRHLKSFRGQARFRSWLCRIARNSYLNEVGRARYKRERAGSDMLDDQIGDSPTPSAGIEQTELRVHLERALAQLPEDQRLPLLLCDQDGLGYADIAHVLDIPMGTVMSRIHYARKKMREKLRAYCEL